MITGNKGEWSELYVLIKLLADGKIYAADGELNRLDDIYFPVVKIIRSEYKEEVKEYVVGDLVAIYVNGLKVKELPKDEFEAASKYLPNEINSKNSKGSFFVEEIAKFMEKILCSKLSAPATNKSDITIKIIDTNTGYSPIVGFYIKSRLGSPATLLNAGKTTNFVYKIGSCVGLMDEVNAIHKELCGKKHIDLKGRIARIVAKGGQLKYLKTYDQCFGDNLSFNK